MRMIVMAALCWPGAALAWERLDGPEIAQALSGRALIYDAFTSQMFHAGGATDYFTERQSAGRWEVRGDAYCSQWPPADSWTCYGVEAEGDALRFIAPDGTFSVGTYAQ